MSLEKANQKINFGFSLLGWALAGVFFLAIALTIYVERNEREALAESLSQSQKKVSSLKIELSDANIAYDEYVVEADTRFNKLEERASLIEASISPKNFRWAKIKQIREVVDDRRHRFHNVIALTSYSAAVYDYSEEYDVPVPLILAVTTRESAFDPKAVSHAGARGLMQIMPATAVEISQDIHKRYYNTFKIKDNVRFGTWYLGKMLNRFNDDVSLAVRAYNCGPTCVEKVGAGEWSDYPEETREYVKYVLKYKAEYEDMGL